MELHGIVIKESINAEARKKLNIAGEKKSRDWTLLKISLPQERLAETEKIIQEGLKPGKFYAHLYGSGRLIVVFREKVFHILADKSTWKPAVEYGIKTGIPRRQLDFKPCKFEDETY